MSRQPIDTAPRDGRKVTIYWTDFDGQDNESIAEYRALGDDDAAGWWVWIDGDTLKRVRPTAWRP